MRLCDVNVFVYAHRPDSSAEHQAYAEFVTEMATGPKAFALSESVLSGFVRVVTNSRIFRNPTPVETALAFCRNLRESPQACILRPGGRNWEIFESLCRDNPVQAKLVSDAWHAALAIEYDCEWVSTDGDFSRFDRLRWRHPLKAY